jgi:predicted aspartyl protease
MKRLKLSVKAKEIVKRLVDSKESEKAGYIAAVDPQTGEIFYGQSVAEAAKEGRKMKNDPKAVFFFVKVGYPSVHVLKSINLQGYIEQEYFPKIKGYVHNRNLHLASSTPDDIQSLDFIADTGFSGYIVLDAKVIQCIDRDYLGEDIVTLAGGVDYPVSVYLIDIRVNTLRLSEVEITEMKEEYLIGIALMRSICKKAIFAFDNDKVLFED